MDTTIEPKLSDASEALLRWVAKDFLEVHCSEVRRFHERPGDARPAPDAADDVIDHLAPIRAWLAELEAALGWRST